MLYECELVDDGLVQECFYREADSRAELLEGLDMFVFPGETKTSHWNVTAVDDFYDEDDVGDE